MNSWHTALLCALSATAACSAGPAATPWRALFDGASLTGWTVTGFGGEGEVSVQDGALHLDMGSPMTGVTFEGEPPMPPYELEVTAARIDGIDFFCGLTFPVRDGHLTLVLGGWGGSVCGLSSLDGEDASRNETRTLRGFKQDEDHTARVVVTDEVVEVSLDGAPFLRAELTGRTLSLRPEVDLCRPLGIASYTTHARIRALRWRPLAR